MRIAYIVLTFFICSYPGMQIARNDSPQEDIEPESYDVYSAVINKVYVTNRVKIIVIAQERKDKKILQPRFKLNVKHAIASVKELSELCIQCANTRFYEKYPDSPGFIVLFPVKFNPDKSEAEFVVEKWCGWLCGEGIWVRVMKKNGKWEVEEKVVEWVS